VVRVAPGHVAETDTGTMLRVWRSAKTDVYRETPIPPNLATIILTVGDVREEPTDAPLVDVTTRTLRRWTETVTDALRDETGDPGWTHVGFNDRRRT